MNDIDINKTATYIAQKYEMRARQRTKMLFLIIGFSISSLFYLFSKYRPKRYHHYEDALTDPTPSNIEWEQVNAFAFIKSSAVFYLVDEKTLYVFLLCHKAFCQNATQFPVSLHVEYMGVWLEPVTISNGTVAYESTLNTVYFRHYSVVRRGHF